LRVVLRGLEEPLELPRELEKEFELSKERSAGLPDEMLRRLAKRRRELNEEKVDKNENTPTDSVGGV
jgi:hypothetical protein